MHHTLAKDMVAETECVIALNDHREDRVPASSMNFASAKIMARLKSGHCRGVFALAPIASGEVVAAWGGQVMDLLAFEALPEALRRLSVQIDDALFLVPQGGENPADYFNHSCQPNAGLRGQSIIVAMRPIAAGEEICYGYAMSDGSGYDEFACGCQTAACRGEITGDDWTRPDLWTRYEGYFSPYLARRIRRLRCQAADLGCDER